MKHRLVMLFASPVLAISLAGCSVDTAPMTEASVVPSEPSAQAGEPSAPLFVAATSEASTRLGITSWGVDGHVFTARSATGEAVAAFNVADPVAGLLEGQDSDGVFAVARFTSPVAAEVPLHFVDGEGAEFAFSAPVLLQTQHLRLADATARAEATAASYLEALNEDWRAQTESLRGLQFTKHCRVTSGPHSFVGSIRVEAAWAGAFTYSYKIDASYALDRGRGGADVKLDFVHARDHNIANARQDAKWHFLVYTRNQRRSVEFIFDKDGPDPRCSFTIT